MNTDPFKSFFKSVDPTRGLRESEIDELVERAQLFQRVLGRVNDDPARRQRQRTWRRAAVISTVAIFLVGGAAAAITLLRSPVTNASQMSCYSQDSVHSKTTLEIPYSAHPLASCKAELHWKLVLSSRTPAGLLCVLPDGTLGGFPPSKKIKNCSSIGLPAFNGKLRFANVLAFENAAHGYFEEHVCPTPTSAKNEMLALIGKYGLRDWVVRVYGSDAPTACATFAVQPTNHIINIVAVREKTG